MRSHRFRTGCDYILIIIDESTSKKIFNNYIRSPIPIGSLRKSTFMIEKTDNITNYDAFSRILFYGSAQFYNRISILTHSIALWLNSLKRNWIHWCMGEIQVNYNDLWVWTPRLFLNFGDSFTNPSVGPYHIVLTKSQSQNQIQKYKYFFVCHIIIVSKRHRATFTRDYCIILIVGM